MSYVFGKITTREKRAALFVGLFLAVFIALFYVVNMDISPAKKPASREVSWRAANTDEKLAKKLGSITFSIESYADWANRYGLANSDDGLDGDQDNDTLPNYLEYIHNTNPLKADTDGDGYADKAEIINGYDPDAFGDTKISVEIEISRINVLAPMVWSKNENEKDMLSDLENGVAHFFKTAAPGQNGNMIISGHSSNYIWAGGDYNHIFKNLNNLEKGDLVIVKTSQKNGRVIAYRYKISDKFITAPNDAEIFENTANPTLTLSTCWPIGTNLKRIVVKAALE